MIQIRYMSLTLLLILSNGAFSQSETRFNLSVIHVNDFHARFEATSTSGGICTEKEECVGGFSRLYKQITSLLETTPDSILLNAGDNFQGSLWYTIGKWNVTQEFLNKLPFDATVLGNHEFEDKIEGLIPFMKALKSPIAVANIDDSLEPEFQGLYNKSTIIERNGKKIGIIGVIISSVDISENVFHKMADTGNLSFYLESPSVNAEAERLVEEEGVFTNIVLSHAGYDVDQAIAANASEKISLIVGGHTHTFLYTGDEQINKDLLPWKEFVDKEGDVVVGSTLVTLDRSKCKYAECIFGNLIADVMDYSWTSNAEKGTWTYASIAAFTPDSVNTNIASGNITFKDVMTAIPYKNTIDVVEIEGKYIKQLLEDNASPYFDDENYTNSKLMQFSGIHVVLNLTRAEGDRVQSLKIRCQACQIPIYEDLNLNQTYRVIVTSYFAGGGEGYTSFIENIKNWQIGEVVTDVLLDYLKHKSPIFVEEEGRIIIHR